MTSGKIKLLLMTLGAAALIATPALAATHHKGKASHTFVSEPQPDAANEIYGWDGRLLSTDPDPNIRVQLLRDQSQGGD